MNFIGIIPARYASSRFPGKPLADICGKPMIQRVYEQAKSVLDDVYVATDDIRIQKKVKSFRGKVVMTSKKHRSGTDRCAEAVEIIQKRAKKNFDVVINIQGDEPFIHPEQITSIMKCFQSRNTQIATLLKPVNNLADINDTNKPKVVINRKNEAVYFSRTVIPYVRNAARGEWIKRHQFYKHIGLYAYRYDILKKIARLKPSPLELAESLEQLRWLENGFRIKVAFTEHESVSIDTPADLKKVRETKLL
jgi:3-deoxy-manno-octulosonate cytidylyltransferase (CMP-KDO synthetase)